MNNKKMIAFILCACLMIAVAGCSGDEVLPPEIYLSAGEPVETVEKSPQGWADIPEGPTGQKEFVGFSEGYLNKEYGSFAEAYLDILAENRLVLTNEQLIVFDSITGEDLGDGKIAVLDVLGDETPELLFLYAHEEKTTLIDPDGMSLFPLYLMIFTYSKEEGVASVFDGVIYPGAGGEHVYCVYITRNGEPMMFLRSTGPVDVIGFWPIMPNQSMKNDENNGFQYDRDFAALCYYDNGELYVRSGVEISKDQFDKASKEIMENIDSVLFQGPVRNGAGYWLYAYELWNDITPFEEHCMTYAEAVAWLEEQIRNQGQE